MTTPTAMGLGAAFAQVRADTSGDQLEPYSPGALGRRTLQLLGDSSGRRRQLTERSALDAMERELRD